jgi:hypothetical protein
MKTGLLCLALEPPLTLGGGQTLKLLPFQTAGTF